MPLLPGQWETQFYPAQAGWHHIYMTEDSVQQHPFFVLPDTAWRQVKAVRQQAATQQWVAQAAESGTPAPYFRPKPYPAGLFFMVFLVCLTALWVWVKW
jgi:hypothetical protein